MDKKDMILVDYRGIEIVRCSECGYKHPRDIPWCEVCGSSKTEKIEHEER